MRDGCADRRRAVVGVAPDDSTAAAMASRQSHSEALTALLSAAHASSSQHGGM
jgi:hypothetical protein